MESSIGTTNVVFCKGHNAPTLLRNQQASHSQNTFPTNNYDDTMVHGQVYRIITWQLPPHPNRESSPINSLSVSTLQYMRIYTSVETITKSNRILFNGEGSNGSDPQRFSVGPRVWDRGALSIRVGWELSGYNTVNLTVDHSVIIIISGKRVLRV
jgi:gamma-glutamylcyclotransferase (GGCT)/AIG2-like uncharacterized protein YtfP